MQRVLQLLLEEKQPWNGKFENATHVMSSSSYLTVYPVEFTRSAHTVTRRRVRKMWVSTA